MVEQNKDLSSNLPDSSGQISKMVSAFVFKKIIHHYIMHCTSTHLSIFFLTSDILALPLNINAQAKYLGI